MTLLYSDSLFLEHDTGELRENANRIIPAIRKANHVAVHAHCLTRSWSQVTDAQLQRVHTPAYIEHVRAFCADGGGFIAEDTVVSERSYEVARMATGAACDAVSRVVEGSSDQAFCLTRPPGHHATKDHALGFCLFNHVAVAARTAIDELGLERVMIVDWDVHHGDGTQEIFWEDERVGFLSIHRDSFCHGTGMADEVGSGAGLGMNVNIPVKFGTSRDEYISRFKAGVEKLAAKIKPQLLLISAGFDSHKNDPVGSLGLESEDFARLTRVILDIAAVHAAGRVVSILEGGYNPIALAESVEQHLLELVSA